jgi:hypothetical protein
MKIIKTLAFFSIVLSVSCNQNVHKSPTTEATTEETVDTAANQNSGQGLTAKLEVSPTVKLNEHVNLKFTVYNNSDSAQTFCKWHTPFEPLMSKYLDVISESGEDVQYKGAMAKRVMPPPASSYITLAPKDSLSVTVNLMDGYAIEKPSTYSVRYNSEEISGLSIKDSVSFKVLR